MADPFIEPLPLIGDKPWTLNPAMQEVRNRISDVDDFISSEGIQTAIVDAAAELNPTALSDSFIGGRVSTSGTASYNSVTTRSREVLSDTIINVQNYGLLPNDVDGSTAWTNIVSLVNGNAKTRGVYFPGGDGNYIIGAGAVFTKTVRVFGDSPDASKLKVKDGSTGDVFTFNARSSTFENLYVDANRAAVASGDTVVLNAGYPVVQRVLLANSPGTGIRVGKDSRAIVARLSQVMTRTSYDYGIWVQQDSTDGLWSDLDIGTAGLSGIRVEPSSQNMSNVHSWGCGSRYVLDNGAGFLILSSGHQMSNCQAETNWEDGFAFRVNDQNGSMLSSCKSWSNGLAGYAFFSYSRADMAACSAYDNGVRNSDGTSTDKRYAGIYNNSSNHGSVAGCKTFDRAVAREYTSPSPTMSKQAVVSQVWDYAEEGTAPFGWAFAGNSFLRADGISFMANGSTFEANRVNSTVPTIALTGSTLAIKANHSVVKVSGTGNFNSLGTDSRFGRIVTLVFLATGISIFENGTIRLTNGAFGSAVDKQITLQWNGTKWVELSRTT